MKKMNKITKNNFITYLMVIVIFAVIQTLSATGHISNLLNGLLVPICVYVIAAISLNLVVGYSGELSLGHAGFMCLGAYSSALFSHVTADVLPSVPRLILAILVGAAVAAVFGLLIGIPVLRLRGDYLAIVTLAFGEIIKNVINILYVGADGNGLHVATSAAGLHMEAGGKQIIKGALGVSGTSTLYRRYQRIFFPDRCHSDPDCAVYRAEPGKFQKRTCHHFHKRQSDRSRVSWYRHYKIQAAGIYDFRSNRRRGRCAVCA